MNKDKYILLLEDDLVDVMTIKRAMRQADFNNNMELAGNGEEGVAFLENCKELPALIILDINMPKMNGIEFLKYIKTIENWKTIPVVILTTSREQQDKIAAFTTGIIGYLIKPLDFNQFKLMVSAIRDFFNVTELPY